MMTAFHAFFVALARLLWVAHSMLLAFLHRMVPSRVLRVRAGPHLGWHDAAGPARLLLGAPPRAPPEALDAVGPTAVTIWDNRSARVVHYLVPGPIARLLLSSGPSGRGRPASAIVRALDETFGHGAARPKGHVIGATHNGRDVTAALRPWSLALAVPGTGATAATVVALIGHASARPGQPEDLLELLWDGGFESQTLRGSQALHDS